MSEKFDWKKVLRGPFGRGDDRSSEVLFLPASEEADGTTGASGGPFNVAPPPPVVKQEAEPTKVYEPPTPLVLPPNTKLDWDEDAYAPNEIHQKASMPEPIQIPEPPKVEGLEPEILQPITIEHNWQDDQPQAAAGAQYAEPQEPEHLTEASPSHAHSPLGPVEPVPGPSETDSILSKFGVQKVPQRKEETDVAGKAESHNELLGDLERLITGLNLQDDRKPAAPVDAEPTQTEAAHAEPVAAPQPISLDSLSIGRSQPASEPQEEPAIEAVEASHATIPVPESSGAIDAQFGHHAAEQAAAPSEEPAPKPENDLASLLASFRPEMPAAQVNLESRTPEEPKAANKQPEPAIAAEAPGLAPESDLAILLAKLNQEEPPAAHQIESPSLSISSYDAHAAEEDARLEASLDSILKSEPLPPAPKGDFSFDYVPETVEAPVEEPAAVHLVETPEPETEAVQEPPVSIHEQTSDPVIHLFPATAESHEPAVITPLPEFGNEAALVAFGAIKVGADLIRLGPIMEKMPIWYRIDGVMHHVFDFDKEEGQKIVAWFKHHAKTTHDDPGHGDYGWFNLRDGHRIHVTGTETAIGELISAKVFSESSKAQNLDSLGFSEADLRQVESLLAKPSGLVIVGAPLGHEATELMSGIAQYLAAGSREVVYLGNANLTGTTLIRTFNLDPERPETHGLTVSRALGLGAPCVVADGISDPLAVASLTAAANRGCLVIARVEAADAWSAHSLWHQALHIGSPLTPTAEVGVVARRQIRTLCEKCKQAVGISDEQREQIHRYLPEAHADQLWTAHGCEECYGVGYRGKVSIHEVVAISSEMKATWSSDPLGSEARQKFDIQAHSGPAKDALACALCGMTSWDEIRPLLDY